jgi:hypothetical protein
MTRKRQNGVSLRVHTYTAKGKRSRIDYVKVSDIALNRMQSVVSNNAQTQCTEHATEYGHVSSTDILLNLDVAGTSNKRKTYGEIKQAEVQEWSRCRDELIQVATELEQPWSFVCELCQETTQEPIRCLDCHAYFVCCADCEKQHHITSFHKPEIWHVSILSSYHHFNAYSLYKLPYRNGQSLLKSTFGKLGMWIVYTVNVI